MIVVPRDALRRLIATDPGLGDTILTAFMARRSVLLSGASATPRIIGSRFCPDCQQLREFVARSRHPLRVARPGQRSRRGGPPGAVRHRPRRAARRHHLGIGPAAPHPRLLAEYLGLTVQSLPDRCFDLVVVGGGPAGLAASVYGASEGLRTLGLEKFAVGRPGGVELADRELPRVPDRDLGRRPDPAGHDPGREVRGLPHRAVRGHVPARGGGPPDPRALRRHRVGRPRRHRRQRCPLPAPRRRPARRVRGHQRVLRGHRDGAAPVRRPHR